MTLAIDVEIDVFGFRHNGADYRLLVERRAVDGCGLTSECCHPLVSESRSLLPDGTWLPGEWRF